MSQYGTRGPAQRQHETWDGGGGAPGERGHLLREADGSPRHVRVAIVGSGFAGLCMGIKLLERGIDDFVILERGDAVGGTWRDNSYPGCACDVPSHLYSYSFEPEYDWPRPYAEHHDIRAYIEGVVDKYGLRDHVQLGANMTEAAFDDASHRWRLSTSAGPLTADIFTPALGGLSNPKYPELPGLERFEGAAFHSARWDHDYDFEGKQVAVIGSGASTIQFLPRIAPLAAMLTLFQRTPPWVMPKADRPFSRLQRWIFRHLPPLRWLFRMQLFWMHELAGMAFRRPDWMRVAERAGRRHIRRHIRDPELRRLLTPDYTPGCKRILLSNDYYPALARDNVHVTGSPICEVRERSVVTADGTEIPVDVILYGTGFDTQGVGSRERIVGRGGAELAEVWKGGPEAYLGSLVAGFPNMFLLGGPNAGLGHNSMIIMIEGAVNQAMQALDLMRRRGATSLEVEQAAQDAYNERVQERLSTTVWNTGCASWYLNDNGKNTAIWPGSAASYALATRHLDESHVRLSRRDEDTA